MSRIATISPEGLRDGLANLLPLVTLASRANSFFRYSAPPLLLSRANSVDLKQPSTHRIGLACTYPLSFYLVEYLRVFSCLSELLPLSVFLVSVGTALATRLRRKKRGFRCCGGRKPPCYPS